MSKVLDIFCLVGWGISIVLGILACCGLITIHPFSYICACLVCILHHTANLIRDDQY